MLPSQEKEELWLRVLKKLTLWIGMAAMVILAVPAGILLLGVFGIWFFVDWFCDKIDRKAKKPDKDTESIIE